MARVVVGHEMHVEAWPHHADLAQVGIEPHFGEHAPKPLVLQLGFSSGATQPVRQV